VKRWKKQKETEEDTKKEKEKKKGKESTLKLTQNKGQIETDKASELCKHLRTQNGK
jgi:hypothetical protein